MKIILFTNLKGGVGKTTLCSLFASYMAEQDNPVAVLDADIQQSLFRHRQRELLANPNAPVSWLLQPLRMQDASQTSAAMEKLRQMPCDIIIDCPGNIQDPILGHIFAAADVAVIPFRYDSDSLDATHLFSKVFSTRSNADMFFVPNCIAVREELREEVGNQRDKAVELLRDFGDVTPRIRQSVVVRQYSTVGHLTSYQRNAVKYAFEPIVQSIRNDRS